MNYIKYFLVILLFLNCLLTDAQSLSFNFGFNDCTGEADGAIVPGFTLIGSPQCVCGPNGMSYELNGIDQSLVASSMINAGFKDDFTFDFYFSNLVPQGESHLLYIGTCSNIDSLMRLRHFSDTDEYLFEISGSINNFFSLKFKVDKSKCWHKLTLVKFGLEYFLYIDSKFSSKFLAKEAIVFPKNKGISLGHNPCPGVTGGNLKGNIDEISFLNRASSQQEIEAKDLNIDRVASPPVTIFKGETVDLTIGEHCGSIIWSPAASLDQVDTSFVIAAPLETTVYSVTTNNGACISKDSVTIYVADKDKLDCTNLLLPSAFTPNGDGRNDFYKIDNTFIVEKLDFFEVYARNGSQVYDSKDIYQGWDGTMNGAIQAAGTYVYRVKYQCNNEEYIATKAFILLR